MRWFMRLGQSKNVRAGEEIQGVGFVTFLRNFAGSSFKSPTSVVCPGHHGNGHPRSTFLQDETGFGMPEHEVLRAGGGHP